MDFPSRSFSAAALALVFASTACSATGARPSSSAPTTSADARGCPPAATPEAILKAFAAEHPLTPSDDPLRAPKSLADVDAILHLDQVDLFDGAARFAASQKGDEALALRAQIEIAHAEAQLIVADLLEACARGAESATRTLRFRADSGQTSAAERALLATLEANERQALEVAAALRSLAGKHAREGAELASGVVRDAPKGYRAYRIAADYHRLRKDWRAFTEAVLALDRASPQSNGLLFARGLGAEALGDEEAATRFFTAALAKDGKFVRAQAHVVLLQKHPRRMRVELEKLRAMNPRHQLVVFATPFVASLEQSLEADGPPPSLSF